jgi:hypothetical protein
MRSALVIGMQSIERLDMVDTVEDWSAVRSPGRARRRRKLGYPQNIVMRQVPQNHVVMYGNTMYVHPTVAAELRRQIARQQDASLERSMYGGLI